jgi:ketosteroid isomerase-like protein
MLVRTLVAAALIFSSSLVAARPLSAEDVTRLRAMSDLYVAGWLRNDRIAVMSVMSPDVVFIPHDGVQPRIGYDRLDSFWFPNGRAAGTVVAFTQTISNISGEGNHALIYGRSDLTWQNTAQRYHWIGNFLIVARRAGGRWLFTHMMASDEAPTIQQISVH